ncbi:MAG: hypothetical protein NT045_01185 [Candidatus Aureabacteria bacterium]|nr:hypothetical protein [Candidatus Auribacterota bacterium]
MVAGGVIQNAVVEGGIEFEVLRALVLRRLQVSARDEGRLGKVRELLDSVCAAGRQYLAPAAVHATVDVAHCGDIEVSFTGTAFRVLSRDVASLLRSCGEATLMALTVGPAVTREIEHFMAAGRMTEAMILDAFASEAAEACVERLCAALGGRHAREGRAPTRRFSPGYGDWALDAQRGVLEALGAGRIGLSVNEQNILAPEKSITAVIGWKEFVQSA